MLNFTCRSSVLLGHNYGRNASALTISKVRYIEIRRIFSIGKLHPGLSSEVLLVPLQLN